MIKVQNLVKKYGDHYAVKGLSFSLQEGKIYGLLGPNGAGKSTTMNMITGYIASTSGEVLIDGHNILTDPEEAKKCIGYLPEIPPLYVDMTVGEYLLTVSELKKIPKRERSSMVSKVMETVKITDMKNLLIKNLSKGYKQRVGIAQALIGFPKIIILDEPTVGLDPKQIIEIRDLVKSLGTSHTVILSSHILSEISAVCDEVLIINKGQLIASDTTENLEKMFLGTNHLELITEGNEARIREILDDFTDIQFLQIVPSHLEDGYMQVQIQLPDGKDLRKELFYAFSKANCAILEMHSASVTLEDIFLELTSRQNEKSEVTEA